MILYFGNVILNCIETLGAPNKAPIDTMPWETAPFAGTVNMYIIILILLIKCKNKLPKLKKLISKYININFKNINKRLNVSKRIMRLQKESKQQLCTQE